MCDRDAAPDAATSRLLRRSIETQSIVEAIRETPPSETLSIRCAILHTAAPTPYALPSLDPFVWCIAKQLHQQMKDLPRTSPLNVQRGG